MFTLKPKNITEHMLCAALESIKSNPDRDTPWRFRRGLDVVECKKNHVFCWRRGEELLHISPEGFVWVGNSPIFTTTDIRRINMYLTLLGLPVQIAYEAAKNRWLHRAGDAVDHSATYVGCVNW